MKQRLFVLLIGLTLALSTVVVTVGCGAQGVALGETTVQQTAVSDSSSDSDTTSSSATGVAGAASTGASGETAVASEAQTVSYDSEDEDATWDSSSASEITLAGDSARFDGTGATVDGSTITITAAGTYVVTGSLADGQIVVDSADEDTVRLVLSGVNITCSDSAPIYVKSADKLIITLADGSENTIADGGSYVSEDSLSDEPNAAIFSKDDLTINGSGSLEVTANYNDGIASKDDLKIVSGTIIVDAVNDAIQGKDCIGVKAGSITVTSGGDGLQATNDQDAEKGYIAIEGGTFVIVSGTDAIQAQTTLAVSGGEFAISSGGGSANSSQEMGEVGNTFGDWGGGAPANGTSTPDDGATTDATTAGSAKALKAGSGIFLTGGTFAIDSSDDSINSNGDVLITGCAMQISSGDDGIHADGTLTIDGGEVTLTQSYEGLEASVITINGGTIHVTASDDGVNVAGGADSSSVSGRPGQNDFAADSDNKLNINGGYLVIDSGGDGLDCNGTITMTGGTAIVNGPVEDMNGALDAQELTISGGFLVAVGSAGMAEAPSDTSAQHSFMVVFDQAQAAGTLVHVESEDGEDVLTFAPAKQFEAAVLSSADLKRGETYIVYLGGTATGTITDGVYSGGAYTPGAENVNLTLDAIVTISGSAGGAGMRGPGH